MSDDEYEIPLRDQRYFGAGIKRKRVQFVPASDQAQLDTASPTTPKPGMTAAEKYLSIVFGKSNTAERASSAPMSEQKIAAESSSEAKEKGSEVGNAHMLGDAHLEDGSKMHCDLCKRDVPTGMSREDHEGSIVHQISRPIFYPPSHIDRKRKGLAVLRSQGWDPDSRKGLGAQGEGMLHPLKAVENPHRAGLGLKPAPEKVKEKPVRLDAAKVRQIEAERKKKADSLRKSFYQDDDKLKYLGEAETLGNNHAHLDMSAFAKSQGKKGR